MSAEAAFVRALRLAADCPVIAEPVTADPQTGVDRDFALAGTAAVPHRVVRVWRNRRCIVATRRQARLDGFARAAAHSEAAGWPVAIRRSGGTAVVHRPGVVNVSLIEIGPADAAHGGIHHGFHDLLGLLERALGSIGIRADHGPVPGAHCDGDYNLRWNGRKLAGTAGVVTRLSDRRIRLFHAAIAADGAIANDLAAIEAFEQAIGEGLTYTREAHVGLAEILSTRRGPLSSCSPVADNNQKTATR